VVSVEAGSRVCGGQVVLALREEPDIVQAAGVAATVTAAAQAVPWLIIDLAALEFIDCGAVGALPGVRKLARQTGGDVLLATPQQPMQRLLTLTGQASTQRIHASAVGSGRGPPRYAAQQPAARPGRPESATPLPPGTRVMAAEAGRRSRWEQVRGRRLAGRWHGRILDVVVCHWGADD
jgi:anti-anti-sigma factor